MIQCGGGYIPPPQFVKAETDGFTLLNRQSAEETGQDPHCTGWFLNRSVQAFLKHAPR